MYTPSNVYYLGKKAYVYMTQSLDIQYKSLALLQMFIPDPLYGNTATGPTMRRPRAWLRHHSVVRLLSQHLCHLSWYNLLI